MKLIERKTSTRNMKKSIFIIEPDNDSRIFYADLLMEKGYNVLSCAKNGKESIRKFKKLSKRPGIIIIEWSIAQKNGFQAIKKLFQLDNNIKFIIFNGEKRFKEKSSLFGVENILKKSFTFNDLLLEIEYLINSN